MLSISPLKSASGAAKYYLSEENPKDLPDVSLEKDAGDNYYLKEKDQGENTFWHGKLAVEAGLAGKAVDQTTLESVLSGNLGDETIKGKRDDHKSGFDLTFSAPKSISILALTGGDTRLIEAHNNAVKFALTELEKDVAQITTINKEGEREFHNTNSMIFAVVRHKTSRENDMQVHSHALAANMTRDQEGQLRTLASSIKQKGGVINGTGERIYNFQKYYGILYQSQLAKEAQDLGYATRGVGNGQFEVSGVPQSIIDASSTRKQQIDQRTLDLGFESRAARDVATLDTRKSKTYQSNDSLNKRWQNTAREQGYEPSQLVGLAQKAKEQQAAPSLDETKAAISRAIDHLGQYNTALHLEKIIELTASEFTKGAVQLNALDIKKAADEMIKTGELIGLSQKGQYTTKGLIDNEKALIDSTQGRAHHMRTHVEPKMLNKLAIPENQQRLLTELYHSTKQFHVVNVHGSSQGIAQQLLNVGNHSGKRVQFVSQSAKTKAEGVENVQRKSQTLGAWIANAFSPEQRHTTHSLLQSDVPLTNKDVLLIDDANKMSANELLALTDKAKQSNSKVVMLNRVSSRQGFKANNAISLYQKGNVESHTWMSSKPIETDVKLHESDTDRIARVYADLPDKADTQVIATSSVEQRRLTEAIRDRLKNTGTLSRHETTLFTQVPHYLSKAQQPLVQHYKPGMTLTHWDKGKPQSFVIASIDKESNTMTTLSKHDGQSHTFDPSTRAFKAMQMQISKPQSLNIAQGERLSALGKHFPSGLEANQSYLVTNINKTSITLESQGKTQHLSLESLKDAPLQYDYVRGASHIEKKAHTLLSAKTFTLSKPLINDLTEKTQRLDIFTDKPDKAQSALEKEQVSPSAIERVLQTQNVNDRYLNDTTQALLKQDVSQALSALAKAQNTPLIEKAVSFALNHLSEREAAFSQKALVVEAVRYAFEEAGGSITKEQIETELGKRSDTLSAEYSDGTRWTTQAALETEKRILQNIIDGKNQHQPFATPKQVQTFLDTKPRLTHGQKDAITLTSTTPDSFVAIQGLAGTGKSTMLESNIELIQLVREASQLPEQNVIGLAPTHAAVAELESKGVKAQTLESLLSDIRQGNREASDYQHTLFFLDESSMVSNKQAKEFTELVNASQSKAVLLGDKEQLLSLSAGKPFELAMSKGDIDTAYMTDMVRPQNDILHNAQQNTIDKQPQSALDKLKQQAPDSQGNRQHVISTLDENNKDQRKAQLEATEKLPFVVAKDYLERTPETRENTLIIAYTNKERDTITEHIRVGLMKNQELGKENIITTRLRSVGATGEELSTMMPYQKGLVLSTKPGEYATITHVDSEHGVVTLEDAKGETKSFLPRNRDHTFTTLFSVSEKPLSTGDKIVTRFTDKSRDIKANVEYRITQASSDGIIAQTKTGETLTINPSELKDGHWDYAYSRTADMAQGATYPHVITAIQSKGALTNLRRAGIDVTRASQHIRLYTDNTTQLVKSWLSKESHKASAIETINQIPPKDTTYFNRNALPHEDVRFQNKSGDFDYNKFREHINTQLPKYTESLATQLLGRPNQSKSDRDYLTFGIGKSAIKVSLTGEHRSYFKDYTTGEKGSLINLMMSHNGMSYKEAMNEAHKMLNEPEKYKLEENSKHEKLLSTTPRHIAKFEERAKEYISQSQPINNTLAQTYLNNLGINNIENDNVKFHPSVYSSEDKAYHPAMLTNIHNKQGETKAIEVTYLDSQGNRDNTLDINPRTLGTKSKQLTTFHQGENLNTTIISTSIENSFLIREQTQGQIDIINVNHKNDIQNINIDELRQNIIIVLNQGNHDLNPNNIEKIIENFNGRDIQFMSDDNLKEDIKSCIEKLERDNIVHDIELSDTHSTHQESELDTLNFDEKKETDSQSLEHFETKEYSPQQEMNFEHQEKESDWEDREIDRELER
ncbi:conjugative transfer relaxase/helicase TraI [Vibrio vulnificus]|uniref:conjugative transfer relaxase/helicase TraI n=1 Tax=Vibrio vulnificus TaxID=672 RepID=UPI00063DC8C8|nr:conjugative transfer relaxase/helicase TraI [Vibrio vulnificus]KLI65619.1 conjugal transfer protein TraI [Vibrio vulnificus CladeA-yb158]MBF4452765.1 conjugative transfer relaxase/helicase TraI [Vibrio vulnificus]MBF4498238.1 conjugative transfer relaxase/helicase TraI [Vibrio vulnificus]MBL6182056.1 conjugative transfer relaxase/helicase TraI [Vibrio vulnificus]HDY7982827.1 conjugative transfer relaxase/helicase TraI [Vibrio vulnificus]